MEQLRHRRSHHGHEIPATRTGAVPYPTEGEMRRVCFPHGHGADEFCGCPAHGQAASVLGASLQAQLEPAIVLCGRAVLCELAGDLPWPVQARWPWTGVLGLVR